MLHALASLGQVLLGVGGGSHLFRKQGTKATAIRRIDCDILTPLGDVVRRVFGHAAGQAIQAEEVVQRQVQKHGVSTLLHIIAQLPSFSSPF